MVVLQKTDLNCHFASESRHITLCLLRASKDLNIANMSSSPSASIDISLRTQEGLCVLTHQALNVDEIISLVSDDTAGATAVFIGTTRNSFKG
jgi:hypothetical protein